MKKSYLLILMAAILFSTGFSQSNAISWRGLEPLSSSRKDAETILGKPVDPDIDLYSTVNEVVTIWFSTKDCVSPDGRSILVPRDTIVGILVSPRSFYPVSKVTDLFPESFTRTKNSEISTAFFYTNADNSISFETRTSANGEDVQFIALRARSKNPKRLGCRGR